jgi:cytidyltransferase-like protein
VVLANGCFDPFHYGHLVHLRQARKMGDRLVVALTADENVNKGPKRPVYSWEKRAEMLKELRCVSEVIISIDAYHALTRVKPDIFVKGEEYMGKIQPYVWRYCEENGIEIAFTDGETDSSTRLLHYYAG